MSKVFFITGIDTDAGKSMATGINGSMDILPRN